MSPRLHLWTVDHLLVCVPDHLGEPRTDALRTLLGGRPSLDAVLELLTADGLAATVPFVCAAQEPAGTRVVIRGDLEAVAHGRDGSSLTLTAGRSTTWNDDVVTDIAGISVALGPDGGRFEWLVGASPSPIEAPPAPVPAPVVPVVPVVPEPVPVMSVGPATDHTLDEASFQQAVAPPAPEPPTLDPPRPDPPPAEPTPEPPSPEPVAPEPITAEPVTIEPPGELTPAGGLDFASLLAPTSAPPPAAPPPAAPTAAPPPPPPPVADATVVRPGIAPPPPPPPPPPPAVGPADDAGTGLGEHDGRTITLADLRRLQAGEDHQPDGPPPGPVEAVPTRPSEVRAVRCPAGHPNPLTATTCRSCGQAITDQTVVVAPRPAVARLVFESGLVIDVDRPQLIGRRPTSPADAEELPNLVTIPSPDGDISRAHAAIRIAGWDVLVEDLGSTNGTEVQAPGGDLVRIREHDPVLAVAGTQVALARTVRFTIERPES